MQCADDYYESCCWCINHGIYGVLVYHCRTAIKCYFHGAVENMGLHYTCDNLSLLAATCCFTCTEDDLKLLEELNALGDYRYEHREFSKREALEYFDLTCRVKSFAERISKVVSFFEEKD